MTKEEKKLILEMANLVLSTESKNKLKELLNKSNETLPETMTSKEAMQVLGCSKQCLNKYLNEGRLIRYKISRRKIMVDKHSVLAILNTSA